MSAMRRNGAGLRPCRWIAAAALAVLPGWVGAATLTVSPITFDAGPGYSMTATGTITTGAAPGSISDWSISVTTQQQLGHYSGANTQAQVSGVAVSGGSMSVATSPDPANIDGGYLTFRSPNPYLDFGVTLANFTGAYAASGQAMYMMGGTFDFLDLGGPAGPSFQVATALSGGSIFALDPLSFSGGVTVTGTITTDGTTGSLGLANILSWDIYVNQTTVDLFDSTNSVVTSALLGIAPNGQDLTVNNPGGHLGFSKPPLGGRAHSLVLADFTDPAAPQGQAAYMQGRLQYLTVPLGAGRGPWAVTGGAPIAPVPLPAALPALAGAIGLLGQIRRRRARPA